jgi:ribonuclease BN (tRNA processing enzyme)
LVKVINEPCCLKFLGTGSGDFYIARKRSDIYNNRYPTQLLLPHGCLIDFSSEAINLLRKYDIAFGSIKNIFITHSQLDHFHAPTIIQFALERKEYSQVPVNIWGTEMIRYILEQEILFSDTTNLITINTLVPLSECNLGYLRILPIPANHLKNGYFEKIGEIALNFIISVGSKRILYAVDTGYPEDDIWKIWNMYKLQVIILEATLGDSAKNPLLGHLNFSQAIDIIKQFRKNKNIEKNGQAILTHLNPFYIVTEEKAKEQLDNLGIRMAFDGMQITI